MDTDSILFVDCLDDFTDELGNDNFITEFVSTVAKSYSYKTNDVNKNFVNSMVFAQIKLL